MTFVSYAQNFEDVMLYRALKNVGEGFYIDVGAWDPVEDSVTKAFYERGWRGMNIEPVRTYYDKLVADRPEDFNLMIAVGARNGMVRFFEVEGTGLSTTDKALAGRHKAEGWNVIERTVPCATLSEICDAHDVREVHFLKIDVENTEKAILQGLDFSRVRPWIVVIEATKPCTQERSLSEWEPLLLRNGYKSVYFDGLNGFYVASERESLAEFLRYPPSVFDNFVRRQESDAVRRADAKEEELAILKGQYQEVEVRLAEGRAAKREHCELLERTEGLQVLLEQRDKQIAQLERYVEALEAQCSDMVKVSQELRDMCSQLRSQVETLGLERDTLGGRILLLEEQLDAVYSSRCWRMTAPLRHARDKPRAVLVSSTQLTREAVYLLRACARRAAISMIRWAARQPQTRALGKQLLLAHPVLLARVRRAVTSSMSTSSSSSNSTSLTVEFPELPACARTILKDLECEIKKRR